MKFLLFNIGKVDEELNDITGISDKKFEELAIKYGKIYEDESDFQSAFNSEHFSTDTHQLRIVEDVRAKMCEKLSNYICDDDEKYSTWEEALVLLENQAEINGSVMADDIVQMWEKVEMTFTVDELLNLITD